MCAVVTNLNGKPVAIPVANGFEQVEMTEPRKALQQAGAQTVLTSPAKGQVRCQVRCQVR